MYKVYFEDRKPIKAEKQSDVIYYFINHNAIGYEKLNNKSAYEELEEKYNRALKEKNKYNKIIKKIEKYIEKNGLYDANGNRINRIVLDIIKGDDK